MTAGVALARRRMRLGLSPGRPSFTPPAGGIGGTACDLLMSFESMDDDDWLETYERFEDDAIARELLAECGAEFTPEDLF